MVSLFRLTVFVGLVALTASQPQQHPGVGPVITSAAANEGADIVFILDGSGSVNTANFRNHFVPFIAKIAEEFTLAKNAYQIAVVQFGNRGRVEIPLDGYYDAYSLRQNALKITYMNENTNTTGGLLETMEIFSTDRYGARGNEWAKIGILLTDGTCTYDCHRLSDVSLATKENGINIIPIGIGTKVSDAELFTLAQKEDVVKKVDMFSSLLQTAFIDEIVQAIEDIVQADPLLGNRPETAKEAVDVIFILDASQSVTETSFNDNVLQLVADVTTQLPMGGDRFQVGIITYGNEASLSLRMKEQYTPVEIQRRVEAIHYRDDMTNTSGALKTFRNLVTSSDWASSRRGDDVPVVGVLITDGYSTVEPAMMLPEAMRAKEEGLKLFVLAVGEDGDIDEELLSAAASEPASEYFMRKKSFDELQDQDVMTMLSVMLNKIQNKTEVEPESTTEPSTTIRSAVPGGSFDEWSCGFEIDEELCGMEQATSDDFDWTRQKGNTPSFETGPSAAKSGTFYIFIEATHHSNQKAVIYLPKLGSSGTHCVSFDYHMYGHHINKLVVVNQSGARGREEIWSRIKTEETFRVTRWHHEKNLNVTLETNDKLGFEGYTGEAHTGDIALDNIKVTSGAC